MVVIDEIGPMELLSKDFRAAVLYVLDMGAVVLGTIVRRSVPFADRIKIRNDEEVIEIQPDNWETILSRLVAWLRRVHAFP